MPIRLCQKCGLKVLIDESQAGTNPFYCQRCTTAMKGQEAGAPAPGPITPVKNPTPSPVAMANRSDPAAPSVGAAKPATVRVLCPYCKASFNGRVPQKPARGSCPVCQKELILLPNGDIKPAAGFDLSQYQTEGAGGKPAAAPEVEPEPEVPKESGTRLLVKKYAADPAGGRSEPPPAPARPAARRGDSAPQDTDGNDEPAALPGWLDDSAGGAGAPVKPQAETDMGIDVVEPKKADSEDLGLKDEEPPPPPPGPRARPPVVAKMPTIPAGRPPVSVPPVSVPPSPQRAPEPEIDLLPPAPPPRPATRRVPSGERRSIPAAAPVPVAANPGETGSGKVFLAFFLLILPLLAGAGLLSSREKLHNDLVSKVGARFSKGFGVLDRKLFPPPPPPKIKVEEKRPEPEPPKEEPPKPDPEQQKKDEMAMSTIYQQILREQRNLKQESVAASPEQQKHLDEVRKEIEAKKARLKQSQDMYKKMYGKEYDPSNP